MDAHASPAIPSLIAALGDQKWKVRQSAAGALGAVGPPAASAIPALLAALQDRKPEVRATVASVLGTMVPSNEAVVSGLITALRDPKARSASGPPLRSESWCRQARPRSQL